MMHSQEKKVKIGWMGRCNKWCIIFKKESQNWMDE